MDVGLAKEIYQSELAKKDQITTSLTLPVGILTVIGGLLGSVIREFSFSNPCSTWVFLSAMIIAATTYVVALVIIMRIYYGYTYSFIPTSRALMEHHQTLLNFYGESEPLAPNSKHAFNEYLMGRYVEANDENEVINRNKTYLLRRARLLLIVMVLTSFVCGVLYLTDYRARVANGQIPSSTKINAGAMHNVQSSAANTPTEADTDASATNTATSSGTTNSQDSRK